MKLISLTFLLVSTLWAKNEFVSKTVYCNNQGTLQYGSIRLQVSPPVPAPAMIPVGYTVYKGLGEWNQSSGTVRVPFNEVVAATENLNVKINNENFVLKKGSLVIGEDGEFYSVVDVFASTGKVAMNKLNSNPNTRNTDPKYFNRGNNTIIYDKSFIRAVSKNCFSQYCVGKKYSNFGNYTFCEYISLLQSQGGRVSSRACSGGQDSRLDYNVDYVFSDGTIIVNRFIKMNLPKLLETYLPPEPQDNRAVQGK